MRQNSCSRVQPSTIAASSISGRDAAEKDRKDQHRERQGQHRMDQDQRGLGTEEAEGLDQQIERHGDATAGTSRLITIAMKASVLPQRMRATTAPARRARH